MNVENKICPECGKTITDSPGFVSWCMSCNWNVNAGNKTSEGGLLSELYERIGRHSGEALKHDAKQYAFKQVGGKFTRLLLYTLSFAINCISLLTIYLGIWLLCNHTTNILAIIAAVICLGMAWVTRPRLGKKPQQILSRYTHKSFYDLVDSVCDSMQAPRFNAIVINEDLNASCSQYGLFRKKVLTLGLPMMDIFSGQELVALIGHEAAHGRNNDPLRGMCAGTAEFTLLYWYVMLWPDCFWEPEVGLGNLALVPMKIILMIIAYIVKGCASILIHLGYRESQLAEFRADLFGAQVAGSDAMLGMLEKFHYDDSIEIAIQNYTIASKGRSFWTILREKMKEMPQSELERLRRMQHISGARLDDTHPPTVDRIEVIEEKLFPTAEVSLSEKEYDKIKHDLSDYYDRIEFKIKDNYNNSIYY